MTTVPRSEQTLSTVERAAVGALLAILAVLAFAVALRVGGPEGDIVGPPESRPMVAENVPRPVPLVDAYLVAAEWAREWNPEAWPILVTMQVEYPPESLGTSPEEATFGFYLFTFAGPKEDGEWPRLTLAMSRQAGTIYHEDLLRSGVEPPSSIAATLTDAPIGAEQAFRVADEVVGQGYRQGCEPSRRQVQVVLDTTTPDVPAWVVVYYDTRERSVNDIVVRVDAQTGQTTTEVRDDTAC